MKRGQVTIYIILGLILLLTVGSILTLYYQDSESTAQDLGESALADSIPSEVLPFYRYAEQCLETTFDRALRIAGSKGGIIYPEEAGMVYNPVSQTESDGVTLFAGSDFGVAYWNYITGSNDCEFGCERRIGYIPLDGDSPGSIASQLELYVQRELPTCLAEGLELEEIGIMYEERGSPEASVTVGATDVVIEVDYPLFVEREDVSATLPAFVSRSEIPLREYYDDALLMTDALNEFSALERGTIQLISTYSGMDSKKLPPMSGSTSDRGNVPVWNTQSTKEQLHNILSRHIPMFTVINSNNYQPYLEFDTTQFADLKTHFYQMFDVPGPSHFSKYDVFFQYVGTSPFMRLNNDDPTVEAESLQLDFFPWFGITRVRTMYDVSYPVLLTLHNQDDDEDYQFSIAYEVNIRNNAPMNTSYVPYDYSQYAELVKPDTFLCDENQRTSEPVSFSLVDAQTNEPLDDVSFLFHCADEVCALGDMNSTGVFSGSLPVCYGGELEILSTGHEKIKIQVNPNIDFEQDLGEITVNPYVEMNVTVKDLYVNARNNSIIGLRDLVENERVMIQLERVEQTDSLIRGEALPTVGLVEYDNPVTEMILLPGNYSGKLLGFIETPFYIHPDERCEEENEIEYCVDIPDTTMKIDTFMTSGMVYSEEIGYFEITDQDIADYDTVILKQLVKDVYGIDEQARVIEDMSAMGEDIDAISQLKEELVPEFE